MYKEL
jgi:hypothetical protein